ncbi:MAG: SulP family inorganic anion transporter [Opitutales bacterium]|nr:SulP family inorganic anion transporter [Opitutales bacterium]
MNWTNRVFPTVEKLHKQWRQYSWTHFGHDVRAGINVAMLDLPQSMAYAMIAGLPIHYGIRTSIIGSLISPLLASSRFIVIGPTNATAVLLFSGFLSLGIPEEQRLILLPTLVLMVSAITIFGALLRFDLIVQYISRSVISGYVTAAAFLIIIKQTSHVLGIPAGETKTFWDTLAHVIRCCPQAQLGTLLFSVSTISIYFLLKKFWKHAPNFALSIVLSSAFYWIISKQGFQLPMLPNPGSINWQSHLPNLDLSVIEQLAPMAIAIALLSLVESSSISKSLAAQSGDTVDISQQMMSIGLACGVGSIASAMPMSGSPTRSALNYESGARSPVSSLISGLTILILFLLFGSAVQWIPKATLASLIICVGLSLIRWSSIKVFLNVSKSDAATFLLTFLSGLLFPLDLAIYLGVGLSVALFLRKVSVPKLEEIDFNERGELVGKQSSEHSAISIVHVEGDLFFGSTDVFLDRVRDIVQTPNLKVIILRMLNAHHIDATASLAICNLVNFARKKSRDVILSGVRDDMKRHLEKSGLTDLLGESNIYYYTPENVTLSTKNALLRAKEITGDESSDVILMVKKKEQRED